jgi:Uma2 family endonuclease
LPSFERRGILQASMSVPLQLLDEAPVRFPVELSVPRGFRAERLATWPQVAGSIEYVDGKLLYLPPCADEQAEVVSGVVYELVSWAKRQPDYVVGTNEAGMSLGKAVRGADAAIWRRHDEHVSGTLRRTPPILAVEVAGEDDEIDALRKKARWYVKHGVEMVWLVFPKTRSVSAVVGARVRMFKNGDRLPAPKELTGLAPRVRDLFFQLP